MDAAGDARDPRARAARRARATRSSRSRASRRSTPRRSRSCDGLADQPPRMRPRIADGDPSTLPGGVTMTATTQPSANRNSRPDRRPHRRKRRHRSRDRPPARAEGAEVVLAGRNAGAARAGSAGRRRAQHRGLRRHRRRSAQAVLRRPTRADRPCAGHAARGPSYVPARDDGSTSARRCRRAPGAGLAVARQRRAEDAARRLRCC